MIWHLPSQQELVLDFQRPLAWFKQQLCFSSQHYLWATLHSSFLDCSLQVSSLSTAVFLPVHGDFLDCLLRFFLLSNAIFVTVHCNFCDCPLWLFRLSTSIFTTIHCDFLDCPLQFSWLSAAVFWTFCSWLSRSCLESRCFGLESRRCCLEFMALLFQDVTATVSSRCLCCVESPQMFSKEREKKTKQSRPKWSNDLCSRKLD